MKKELRRQILSLRNQLSKTDAEELSAHIIENIKKTFDFKNYRCVGLYMPLGNEVNVVPLIEYLLIEGIIVCLPRVIDRHSMEFIVIDNLSDLEESSFHVLEPKGNKKMPKNEIDILFIPGIAFDVNKYRLGFGGGYYDRYLIDYPHKKVGICYSFQFIDSIPALSYDIPMDYIIMENRVHPYRGADLN